MKFSSNCTLVASTLSALYQTYNDTRFHPPRLEDFLSHNGILLTMCMRFNGLVPWMECSLSPKDTKISASWIQTNQTRGFRVIGMPIDLGPPVGLVLKPNAMKIRCLFSADAATNGRDGGGCGPPAGDAYYGSKGYDHAPHWWNKALRSPLTNAAHLEFHGTSPLFWTWREVHCGHAFLRLMAKTFTWPKA